MLFFPTEAELTSSVFDSLENGLAMTLLSPSAMLYNEVLDHIHQHMISNGGILQKSLQCKDIFMVSVDTHFSTQ